MAVALVQSKSARATSGSVSVTLDAAPTPGNFLVVVLGTNSSIAQTPPSGYATLVAPKSGPTTTIITWSKVAAVAESATVTVTPSAGNQWDLHVMEFSGLAVPTVDKSASADSSTSTVTTLTTGPTASLAGVGDLVLELLSVNASVTGLAAPGYTTLQNTQRLHSGYLVDADQSAKSAAPAWTTAARAVGLVVAISPAAITAGFEGWGIPA